MFSTFFSALFSNKAQLEFLIRTEWDICSEYEYSSLFIEQNSAAKRATLETTSWSRMCWLYFCEIIHEGAEWLEVYSRSVAENMPAWVPCC